ncbi:MAG: DUF3473 domain-containing protein [Candidatus Omnitrophica bacterium]|nr:DUF3473 domain-containing protein [Candidatus Omnitrophota bacterium]
MINVLTFDTEEWFQSHELGIEPRNWQHLECRVCESVKRILAILNERGIKATFFVVGWIAQRYPELVREIVNAGHEVGSHGYAHEIVYEQTPEDFEEDLKKSLNILKDITGKDVIGYRAPYYSITKDSLWALDILQRYGLKYDSSIYPISLRMFTKGGIKGYISKPCIIKEGLFEFPMPVTELCNFKLPVATGIYFRLFPYRFTRWAIEKANKRGLFVTVNLHPWEFDPLQPRVKMSLPYSIKRYTNLHKTEQRFRRLLDDFDFTSCKHKLKEIFEER